MHRRLDINIHIITKFHRLLCSNIPAVYKKNSKEPGHGTIITIPCCSTNGQHMILGMPRACCRLQLLSRTLSYRPRLSLCLVVNCRVPGPWVIQLHLLSLQADPFLFEALTNG